MFRYHKSSEEGERMPRHGKNLARIYVEAVMKRLRGKK